MRRAGRRRRRWFRGRSGGFCLPVTAKKMQCGQLWVEEWNGVGGAPELFTLLQSWRQEAKSPSAS